MRLAVVPAHLGIIERPRLARALSEAPRLIVLLGPAGYGKTTLARQLICAAGDVPVAWHGCQPGSADVASIALGLCDALERLSEVQLSEVRARVRTSPNPQGEAEVRVDTAGEVASKLGLHRAARGARTQATLRPKAPARLVLVSSGTGKVTVQREEPALLQPRDAKK